ncbi:excinuclease ABC subunit A [Paenibacillus sp. H1-7]|uniref:excinuclease ABC subunit UvrA n=1 Tax=Paenibacillus sp. H1-7 TaxID=2282849 RepID=UPI001EF845E1|nr:excinuclease ABC subunit UvrA [Paenibacillus sp. H1-7]ULL18349.1 excinuclease ABC subunit A [Paenibacillus sp. H1-7]
MNDYIEIKGAREHNLKNISLRIPKYKLVVLTGMSGSGKSSLAMRTLQQECQRQYMESMGMVTDYLSKPDVDSITGLSPSISIGQHNNNRNPRSTVGTVTEIYTYLRVLFARLGERSCPSCGHRVKPAFEQESPAAALDKESEQLEEGERSEGQTVECPACGHRLEQLTMAHFSFNKWQGACPTCSGLGFTSQLRMEAIFDMELSVSQGGVKMWDGDSFLLPYYTESLQAAANHYGFEFDAELPIKSYNEAQRTLLFDGVSSDAFQALFPGRKPPKSVGKGKFEGVVTTFTKKYNESLSDEEAQKKWSKYFATKRCTDCGGTRLRKESRQVTLRNASIVDIAEYDLDELWHWLQRLQYGLGPEAKAILQPILSDLTERIRRLLDIGLSYLTLSRPAVTLSGGEAQRLRIAALLGSGLTGVLYILDEPTTGLHPQDSLKLIQALQRLRNLGNTVLLIEHDTDVMEMADHLIDMGPGAGRDGGYIVAEGTPQELRHRADSVTAPYLGARPLADRPERRTGSGRQLVVRDASEHNLKQVSVSVPLNRLIAITGVSGSGKSTFLFEVIEKAIQDGYKADRIQGTEQIDKLITVHQEPVGKISRSNIATYTDLFTAIRSLYAGLPEARKRGLTPKHFSFNTAGGRCEKCKGLGVLHMDMHFLPDVDVPCPVCGGKRFRKDILEVKYDGYSISDVLDRTAEEGIAIFEAHRDIKKKLELLAEVGLGYVKLGQPTSTLSGGEAQRMKLSRELGRSGAGHALFLLDEPTTGLHPADVERLIRFLNKLVDAGHSVIVIEHNLDVICAADWILDFGPEGGKAGGRIIAQGTPEEVQYAEGSYTAAFVKQRLSPAGREQQVQ